jgi:hypothetical protein
MLGHLLMEVRTELSPAIRKPRTSRVRAKTQANVRA